MARTKTQRAIALALAAGFLAASTPALAQENDWLRFGASSTTSSIDYDREFIKSWEKNPPKGYPTISSSNLAPMKAAIARYDVIVKSGGWQPIPDVKPLEGKSLQQGATHPSVALIKARLIASGDLEGGTSSGYFDSTLETAVKRFQAENGLTPTGIVDERTVSAMNVPAEARLKQLKVNLGRVAELAGSRPKRYVIVNIPAAQVEAVENNAVVSRHTGVVG